MDQKVKAVEDMKPPTAVSPSVAPAANLMSDSPAAAEAAKPSDALNDLFST